MLSKGKGIAYQHGAGSFEDCQHILLGHDSAGFAANEPSCIPSDIHDIASGEGYDGKRCQQRAIANGYFIIAE